MRRLSYTSSKFSFSTQFWPNIEKNRLVPHLDPLVPGFDQQFEMANPTDDRIRLTDFLYIPLKAHAGYFCVFNGYYIVINRKFRVATEKGSTFFGC
jgi:hypothetical protein